MGNDIEQTLRLWSMLSPAQQGVRETPERDKDKEAKAPLKGSIINNAVEEPQGLAGLE